MTDDMKSLFKQKLHATSIVSSPWVLAAAVALLVFTIATFALYNYRLEKRLMLESLEQRAATLVRVLQSALRMTMLNELRQHGKLEEDWPQLVQQVVVRVRDEHAIRFLSVANAEGLILAHSDARKVGGRVRPDFYEGTGTRDIRYGMSPGDDLKDEVSAFTASLRMTLFRPDRGPFLGANRFLMGDAAMVGRPGQGWPPPPHPPMLGPGPPPKFPDMDQQIFLVDIGLDADAFKLGLARLKWQILLLSLAMLLVGLGGWLSLAAVQGYRVSQRTVEKAQAYTVLLVAQLPLGVIATTPKGRIETWNEAMVRLTGTQAKEARGRLPHELLPPALARFFDEGDAPQSGQRLELSLGGERRVLLCRPVRITDALQSYRGRVLLLSDITEMSDLEQSMRENERMAAIGRMAGGVAHEVRNPLSSIKGLAFLLKNKFPEGSGERESAELLVQETERLNRTITEMLNLTRPAPLHLAPVDMDELVRQSLALMRTELEEHHIAVRLRLGEAGDEDAALISGDADRLRQVLMNVLLNARQAMEEGGVLNVTAGPSADGRWYDLELADTGCGIPPDILPQIFDPYVTAREGGTGIGLAISHKIVTEHRGTILIRNREEGGTLVRIRLPLEDKAKAASII